MALINLTCAMYGVIMPIEFPGLFFSASNAVEKATNALDINLKSVVKAYNGHEIKEKTYSTKLINNIELYTNESATLECFTLVKGTMTADSIKVLLGSTVLL